MMNLKSYLRGLGIGVVVTALIMGITTGRKKETLSNEEIKERARALGMIEESQVLADVLGEEGEAGDTDEPDSASDALSASVAKASPAGEPDSASAEDASPDTPEDSESEGDMPEGTEDGDDEPEDSADDAQGDEGSEADSVSDSENDEEGGSEADLGEKPENQENVPEASDNGTGTSAGGSVTIEIESGEGSFIVCQKLEDAGLVPLASEFDRYLYENGYDKRINIGSYEIPEGAGFEEIARIIAKLN